MIIDSLRQEHRNIEKLLLVLERELSVFDREERPELPGYPRDYRLFSSLPPLLPSSPRGHDIREAERARSRRG